MQCEGRGVCVQLQRRGVSAAVYDNVFECSTVGCSTLRYMCSPSSIDHKRSQHMQHGSLHGAVAARFSVVAAPPSTNKPCPVQGEESRDGLGTRLSHRCFVSGRAGRLFVPAPKQRARLKPFQSPKCRPATLPVPRDTPAERQNQ